MTKLRDYQEQRVAEAMKLFKKSKRVRVTMACGSGKTEVAQAIVKQLKAKRVLVATSGRDLADQLSQRFVSAGVDAAVFPYHESTTLAAAQEEWDLVVLDEAHRVNPAAVTLQPMTGVGNDKRPHLAPVRAKRFLLMTATDNKISKNNDTYGTPTTPFTFRDAVAAGAVVPLKVVIQSAEALRGKEEEDHSEWIIEAMSARPLRSVVFHRTIGASEKLHAQLMKDGSVKSAHISSKAKREEITQALADLKSGKIDLLTNPNKISEGVDIPALDAVFMTAPTKSDIWAVQRAGRAARLSPGKKEGLVFLPAKASADGKSLDKTDKRYGELIEMLQELLDADVVQLEDITFGGKGFRKLDLDAVRKEIGRDVDPETEWLDKLEACKAFKAEHGRWPSMSAKDPEEKRLGNWISAQRSSAAGRGLGASAFTAERRRLCQECGLLEGPDLGAIWMSNLEACKAFKATHGRWPSTIGKLPEEKRLGNWISAQRQTAKGRTDRPAAAFTAERRRLCIEAGIIDADNGAKGAKKEK